MSESPLYRAVRARVARMKRQRGRRGAGSGSELDHLIPPEITGDAFSEAIEEVAATVGVREVIEIGSSAGDGSTESWVRGALRNPVRPRLHCVEVSVERYGALAERWREQSFVCCYNVSSVPLEQFPSAEDVTRFYREVPSRLREYELEVVLGWRQQDIDYLLEHDLSTAGIREIKEQCQIDVFDAALIDGSEFTGRAELDEVYGARFLLLDDTQTFKNWDNLRRLEADPTYRLIRGDPAIRNGFAVFERVDPKP